MLKFDESNKAFEQINSTGLKAEKILERYDLQESIVDSWNVFRNEIGLPTSILVGDEIRSHPATNDSIDLLAFNPDDSSLIVIELKRDQNKLQLLQALSYAAMVSTWDSEILISKIKQNSNADYQELVELISGNDLNTDVRIVLVAEGFDPEVIITADWLSTTYSVDISAYALGLHRMNNETIVNIEQRYPLKGLADSYEARGRKAKRREQQSDLTWQEVIPKLEYSFAAKGIELCSKIKAGEPSRRRFGSIRTDFDGFNWISINFRKKYINVYLKGDFNEIDEFLQSKFSEPIVINSWRDGVSFLVETEPKFNDLVKWLKLDNW